MADDGETTTRSGSSSAPHPPSMTIFDRALSLRNVDYLRVKEALIDEFGQAQWQKYKSEIKSMLKLQGTSGLEISGAETRERERERDRINDCSRETANDNCICGVISLSTKIERSRRRALSFLYSRLVLPPWTDRLTRERRDAQVSRDARENSPRSEDSRTIR